MVYYEEWRAEQSTVTVATENHEHEVAYYESGSGDPVTVFLHGIPTWGFLFRDVYDIVEHAIVPDLAGWGYSEHVGEGEFDRALNVQETLVRNLLDELGHDSVQIVSHDTGGSVALRLAVYSDVVDRLVLSNIGSYDSWPVEFVVDMSVPEGAGGPSWTTDAVEERLEMMIGAGTSEGRATDEFVQGIKAPFVDGPRAANAISRHASAYNVNHTTELTPHLGDVDAPTLLLWGKNDEFQPPKWAEKLEADLPDAETEHLDTRHWLMQDDPEGYRAAIDGFFD